MSLAALMNQACTITTRTAGATTDRYNNPVDTEATTSAVCYCEQRQRTEDTVNANTQTQDWLIMFPLGTTVAGADKVTVGTLMLEVVGPPWTVHNPRTRADSHIECNGRMIA